MLDLTMRHKLDISISQASSMVSENPCIADGRSTVASNPQNNIETGNDIEIRKTIYKLQIHNWHCYGWEASAFRQFRVLGDEYLMGDEDVASGPET
jgi:hypothetical protein